jgi:hypothetical protein
MEDTQGVYNQEDEIIGMYVNMGNEGINSNGHGEGKEESMKSLPLKFCKRMSKVIKMIMRGLWKPRRNRRAST